MGKRRKDEASRGTGQPNEGEGNKTAARRYNEEASKSAAAGTGKKKGPEAAQALDRTEGQQLREAEAEGKRHAGGEPER
jgi:hypothetical protein